LSVHPKKSLEFFNLANVSAMEVVAYEILLL